MKVTIKLDKDNSVTIEGREMAEQVTKAIDESFLKEGGLWVVSKQKRVYVPWERLRFAIVEIEMDTE